MTLVNRRSRIALLVLLTALVACSKPKKAGNGVSGEEGNVVRVSTDDAGMNAAIANAQRTSATFLEALRHQKPGMRDFALKKPYPTDQGREHLWIVGVREVGDHLEGDIGNEPDSTREVRFGQHVSLDIGEISDWKYIENDKLVGGFTIRYQVSKMSAADKQALMKQLDYTVE